MHKVSLPLVAIVIIVAVAVAIIAGILLHGEGLNVNDSPTASPAPSLTPTPTPSPSATPTNIPITVSGGAGSAALCEPQTSSIQKIEFTDVQTGVVTSFNFNFPKQSNNPFGKYSVVLMNEHTYNVTISYYMGFSIGNMQPASDYIDTFTVNATAGQTAITEDFGWSDYT